ncbi:MAG: glutamate 5-kinase [Spirochaetes bacterium]|nr:glutamate 5-kinase [Spirochaetota bacterium]
MKAHEHAAGTTIVVKIGSAQLAGSDGTLAKKRVDHFAERIVALAGKGHRMVLVTSGAVASGSGVIYRSRKPVTIPEKQAAASVGQITLMAEYLRAFALHGRTVGQMLLSEYVLRDRVSYLNARATLNELLANGVIPVINENDSIATEELKFGDNDYLGAIVACLVEADRYVILTDTEGLYRNYNDKKTRELISVVEKITPEIRSEVSGKTTKFSTGGMESKLRAMELVMRAGITGVIAPGAEDDVLLRIASGERAGTSFLPVEQGVSQRKKWILGNVHLRVKGSITVDRGAVTALVEKNKSLLPGGIIAVAGRFSLGDAVNIVDEKKNIVARGMVNYSNVEIAMIKGRRSSDIASILGSADYEEIVHRDNMALVE